MSDSEVWKRAYKFCQLDIFPAIKILLSILATLPVSSATAERSLCTLRLIKSDLRTIMDQARLDGTYLVYIHNDISIGTDVIIKKFAATSHKIKLLFLAAFLCCNYCKQFLTPFVNIFQFNCSDQLFFKLIEM